MQTSNDICDTNSQWLYL